MLNWQFVNETKTIDVPTDAEVIFIDELIDSDLTFNITSTVKIIFKHDKNSTNSNINFDLKNDKAHLIVREVAFTDEKVIFQKAITISHNSKGSYSDYKFFGFATDNSKLNISAKSRIFKGMSKSEAHQIIRVITSDQAQATGEPGLFIDDYDVKASHGNSIGQVNERELYYLQSKGIDRKSARWMILEGKVHDALEGIGEKVKTDLIDNLRSKVYG